MSPASAEVIAAFIETLRRDGVRDQAVLDAMARVPRDLFVDAAFAERAWENLPLPIACAQTISQPSVVARMTEALELDSRCKVLEVGAGSGYQTAILSRLARRVYSLERHGPLMLQAKARLEALQVANVVLSHGDGGLGWTQHAPFDRILAAAAAPDVPRSLLDQLRPGGVMVLPIGDQEDDQELLKVVKSPEGEVHYTTLGPVRFVPLLQGTA